MFLKKIKFIDGISSKILKNLQIKKINFAFLDGSHEYEDVKKEFEFVDKRNSKNDIIIFDDYTIGKFDGIVKLIQEIQRSKQYEIKILDKNIERGYAVLKKL